jgi:hypothetical protein|eukprot:COSAG01_NODE_1774_length_9262_cov_24.308305_6_plen_89_part_00
MSIYLYPYSCVVALAAYPEHRAPQLLPGLWVEPCRRLILQDPAVTSSITCWHAQITCWHASNVAHSTSAMAAHHDQKERVADHGHRDG